MRSVKRTITSTAVLTTALVVAATATAAPAPAAPPSARDSGGERAGQRVLARGIGAPFQIALGRGHVYYTDGFAGTINKITPQGPKVVRSVPAVSGVEFSRNGRTMAFAHGGGDPSGPPARVTLMRGGKAVVVAKLDRFENRRNPDKRFTYGITTGASPACKTQITAPQPGSPPGSATPATYRGAKDSHPYQVEALRNGAFAVADAGANGVLRVGRKGRISVIALLPPQRVRLSASRAAALGAPACAGETYAFESVPTDVERVGNALWVTTLPGGPESPALGARGSVYRIKNGVVRKMAGRFLGATNLAAVRGRVYVTELFAGKVTKFGKGGRFTRYTREGAVSVEATRRFLYVGTASTGATPTGRILRLNR